MRNCKKKTSGYQCQYHRTFCQKLNRKITYLTCPFAPCITLLKEGSTEMIVGVKQSSKKEKYLTFLEQPFHRQNYLPQVA